MRALISPITGEARFGDFFFFAPGQGNGGIFGFEAGSTVTYVDQIVLRGFVGPSGDPLTFADLDTNESGLLDQGDANVDVGPVSTRLLLTEFAPQGTDSNITLFPFFSRLDPNDVVFLA